MTFCSGLIGLIPAIAIAGMLASLGNGQCPPDIVKLQPVATQPLVSLRNEEGTAGKFFLGSGIIETTPYYFAYAQTPGRGYRLMQMPHDKVTVYEERRNDGTLAILRPQVVGKWAWILPIMNDVHYAVHIPAGSIQRKFALR